MSARRQREEDLDAELRTHPRDGDRRPDGARRVARGRRGGGPARVRQPGARRRGRPRAVALVVAASSRPRRPVRRPAPAALARPSRPSPSWRSLWASARTPRSSPSSTACCSGRFRIPLRTGSSRSSRINVVPARAPGASSYPDFFDWRAAGRSFSAMAAYHESGVTLTGVDRPGPPRRPDGHGRPLRDGRREGRFSAARSSTGKTARERASRSCPTRSGSRASRGTAESSAGPSSSTASRTRSSA